MLRGLSKAEVEVEQRLDCAEAEDQRPRLRLRGSCPGGEAKHEDEEG